MKKKSLIIFTLVLGCSIFSFLNTKQKVSIPSIMLANVDALAEGEENYEYMCFGSGSFDCPNGSKVAYVVWPMSLEEIE